MSVSQEMTAEEYNEFVETGVLPLRFARKKVIGSPLQGIENPTSPKLQAKAKVVNKTKAKDALEDYLMFGGWGRVKKEYQFHPYRKWRADYYLMDQVPPIIVEYEGIHQSGDNVGHVSITGVMRDIEKYNEATRIGIRVFRATAENLRTGVFFELMNDVLRKVKP